jgi:hypothetical protein
MAERLARIYGTEEDKVSTTGTHTQDRGARSQDRSVCLCAAAVVLLAFRLAALLRAGARL